MRINLTEEEWQELKMIDDRVRNGNVRISARNVISMLLNDFYDNKSGQRVFPIWSQRFGSNSKPANWREMLRLERFFINVWADANVILVNGKHVAYGDDEPFPDEPEKPVATVSKSVPTTSKAPVKKAPVAKQVANTPKPTVVSKPESKPVVEEPKSKSTKVAHHVKRLKIFDAQVYAGEILDEHTDDALSQKEYDTIKHGLSLGKHFDDNVLYKFYLTQLALLHPVTQNEAETAYAYLQARTDANGNMIIN